MTGQEIIDWIEEHNAEDVEVYIEVRPKLFKASNSIEIPGSEDCPCMDLIVIS